MEALHGAVPYFRKVEPAWLQLPNYPSDQLAAITAQKIGDSGYQLAPCLGERQLQQALNATWSRDVLAMRNAHLPTELVQRAISNRNQRCGGAAARGGRTRRRLAHAALARRPLRSSCVPLPLLLVSPSLALSRRGRLPLGTLLCSPLVLADADFGLEQQGLDSLLAERQATAAEVREGAASISAG